MTASTGRQGLIRRDCLLGAALIALAAPAHAQDAGPQAAQSPAQAQDAPPATATSPSASPASPSASPSDAAQDEIVVVGTAGEGVRRQNAAFAVTTVDRAAIERINPSSTADLLRIVPGVTVESSGGQNGANIFVRGYPSGGDAEFITFEQEGVPVFPPPTLSFLENSQLIRFDETTQRVEAVRGGTGSLFGAGQPGLTVNVVQKQGGDELHGLAKISGTDFGTVRADGYVSGPIGKNTTALIGGFYENGNGIRNPRFTAEEGGQISGNIHHSFDRGQILVFGKYLNDHGQWLLPIPINQNGGKISGYPGFDYGWGTFEGPQTANLTRNDGTRVRLAHGRGAKVGNLGFNADYALADGLKLRDRFSWIHGAADTTGLVPSGTPTTAGAVAASYGTAEAPTSLGTLTYVNGGGTVPLGASQPVAEAGLWTVRKQIDAEVNDGSIEWKQNHNTLTAGFYYAHTSTHDDWNLGNNLLLTLAPNAQLLNLTLSNGQIATRDGFIGGSFYRVNATYDAYDYAPYLVDEWQATRQLRVDGGFRWQKHDVYGQIQNLASADLDGNPNTLYDNGNTVYAPGFSPITYRGDNWSGTAGINYDISRQLGAFGRFSHGNVFPFFDNLRSGLTQTQTVDSYEAGLKATTRYFRAYLTYFHNDFQGLATTQITNGTPIPSFGGARTNGVELEGALTPFRGFSFGFAATYLDAKYRNFISNVTTDPVTGATTFTNDDGHKVQRQPTWQFRLAPTYEAQISQDLKGSVFSSFYYTGDRYSDIENQQLLPSYVQLDVGAAVTVRERITFQITGNNVTNELGLTEGNPRVVGSQGAGTIFARPILGRSFTFSGSVRF